MIWKTMLCYRTADLYFFPSGINMNGQKYLALLNNKLKIHMDIHDYNIFMHDGAPCSRSKIVSPYLKSQKFEVKDGRCFLVAWHMSAYIIALKHDRPKPNVPKQKVCTHSDAQTILHYLALQSKTLVILLRETHCTDAKRLVLPSHQLAGSF